MRWYVAALAIPIGVGPALPERMVVGWHVGLDGTVSLTRGPRLFEIPAHLVLAALGLGQAWLLAVTL